MMSSCEQNKFSWIDGFGEDLDEIVYEGMSNWLISFKSLTALFGGHYSYFIIHLCIIAVGVLTLQHARANGPRFLLFWWGAMIHGILSESSLTARKYWHAQALVMLFGKRFPLHMLFYYPSVLYLAVMVVQTYQLSICVEPVAIGLLAMIMEIPFRIISVKFLHITYHDSDPIYISKFYGVPWIEIFSALVFAASYIANYYALKYYFLSEEHVKWEKVECGRKEAIVTAASGVLSTISAFLQKVIFFHILYDIFNVNPSTCLFFLFTIYFSILMCLEGKEKTQPEYEPEGKAFLGYALGVYIMCLLYVAMLCKPQNEVSIGAHEPIGDCTTLICSRSPLGKVHFAATRYPNHELPTITPVIQTLLLSNNRKETFYQKLGYPKLLKRKKYLCVDDVQERSNFVYNFSCLPEGPPFLNAVWYTICGTPIRNRAQFITNIFSFIILISTIFLKGWLSEENKTKLRRKLSSLKVIFRQFPRRSVREPVVTFEEPPTESEEDQPEPEEPE